MKRMLIAYFATAATLLVMDIVWLTTMAQSLYRTQLPGVMLDNFRPVPAVLFYLIYVAGIVYLAIVPGLEQGSLGRVLLNGAALGLVAYATYDLTNQATMKVWSTTVTLADIAWGTVLTATAATTGAFAAMRWGS